MSLSLSSPQAVMTIGGESILHSKRLYRISESYRPGDGEMICPTPADGSSTRGGSTSVSGRVRSPHISSGRPAARSQHAYSPGWDRQTDRSRYCLIPPPPLRRGHNKISRTLASIFDRHTVLLLVYILICAAAKVCSVHST